MLLTAAVYTPASDHHSLGDPRVVTSQSGVSSRSPNFSRTFSSSARRAAGSRFSRWARLRILTISSAAVDVVGYSRLTGEDESGETQPVGERPHVQFVTRLLSRMVLRCLGDGRS